MQKQSFNLPKQLSEHPEVAALRAFLQRLLTERGEEVEFAVLFGSAAKGTWTVKSDLDVFVGLAVDDGQRLTDRIGEMAGLAEGNIEVFPYARSEWKRMFAHRHPLVLAVLEDGVVLFDRGEFARLRAIYEDWRATGKVVPDRFGWWLAPDCSARLE